MNPDAIAGLLVLAVSCGIAAMLGRADDALYAAKRGGRDRVCTAASPTLVALKSA